MTFMTSAESHVQTKNPVIALRDLEFAWSTVATLCLKIPYFRVNQGERIFLHGPSGSGKTTLIHLIAGLVLPTQGHIHIGSTPLGDLTTVARDRMRARTMGILSQAFNLIPYLSVLENLRLTRQLAGGQVSSVVEDAGELMSRMGIPSTMLLQKPTQLTQEQQQRVAVVRGLINKPMVLIADEPTARLDSTARKAFIDRLIETASLQQSAVLFVSHESDLGGAFDRRINLQHLNAMHGSTYP